MTICTTLQSAQKVIEQQANAGRSIGFVPTMGALHQGHLQLLKDSKNEGHFSMVSIFVNPTQFNNAADFELYPRLAASDIDLLLGASCDLLFMPAAAEMYAPGLDFPKGYALGPLEGLLEGAHRPGHFQGVCQIMHRLLHLLAPTHLYMGQKDYQQCMVVQWLIDQFKIPVAFQIAPTVREKDGLAMSSRNRRLTPEQRQQASAIYQQLQALTKHTSTHFRQQEQAAAQALLDGGFSSVDYVSIADRKTLEPVPDDAIGGEKVALIAAFMGEVRLIDNQLL